MNKDIVSITPVNPLGTNNRAKASFCVGNSQGIQ